MNQVLGHPWSDAVQALESARDILLASSQQAGASRDWQLARRLVELAERTDLLREEICGVAHGEIRIEEPVPVQAFSPTEPPARSATTAEPGYPRYWVRGGMLVKQGLGRKGGDVYEHAVPREQFGQIVKQLTDLTARRSKREFSVDQVHKSLPDLPKYMIYLVTSLLLKEGVLEKARKGAYLFARPGSFASEATGLWDQLQKAGQV